METRFSFRHNTFTANEESAPRIHSNQLERSGAWRLRWRKCKLKINPILSDDNLYCDIPLMTTVPFLKHDIY